jgi:hypothetical protein
MIFDAVRDNEKAFKTCGYIFQQKNELLCKEGKEGEKM